ncbi:MAG TPA: hypothetical protein VF245_01630 [Solirubrobacterales bacterium]
MALVAGAVAASLAFGAEPVWKPLAPAPQPRQEVTYAALDGRIYLAAGNALEQDRYDPSANSWAKAAPLPSGFADLDHVGAAAVDGKLIYAGGLAKWEYPFPVSDEVAIYDPASDSFVPGADMPSPRAAGGVVAWHGKLIYAGGLGPEGSVARVDAYDPMTAEWARLADMPRPRDHFQAVIAGNELYAIGGRRTFESGGIEIEDLAPVDELELPADDADLASAAWKPAVTSIPTPRGGLGVAAVGACIFAIGGERTIGGSGAVTGVTESYDTVSGAWRELPPLAVPRHGIQAAVVGQTIYVAGGGTKSFDYAPTDVQEALDVSATAPCVASEGVTSPTTTATTRPIRITHLAVRPRKVQLHDARHRPNKAKIVVVLSRAGWISLRGPGRLHISRRLRAGRNVLPLPVHPHGRALPPGRHHLRAKSRTGNRRSTWFRVVR